MKSTAVGLVVLIMTIMMPFSVWAFDDNVNEESDITPFFELVKADALNGAEIPVITSPKNGEVFNGDENINIYFDYEGDGDCYVMISGIGSVSVLEPIDNAVTIAPGKLLNGSSYCIMVSDGNANSEVVEITVDEDGKLKYYNDIQNIVNSIDNPDIPQEVMFPDGFFTSQEEAEAVMTTVRVKVHRLRAVEAQTDTEVDEEELSDNDSLEEENLDEEDTQEAAAETQTEIQYEDYTETIGITVNNAVAQKVKNIFAELYELGFPVNSAACFCWRDTHGGRLSEHSIGTAIDINPNENYCLYSDGSITGSLYAPGENPYSVTDEVVAVFAKYGFHWGGDWDSPKDYMHFSYYDT